MKTIKDFKKVLYNNGIDVFKDTYKLGSVNKAYYQVMLNQYADFE